MKDFLIKEIYNHLVFYGFSKSVSAHCAQYGYDFFERSICNSRDPYKDACDHAGALAETKMHGVKYKSPKAKSNRRSKRPQEAFKF